MSTQWNQQLSRYVFSKGIKFLEKTFANKSITKDSQIQKHMNNVQNIFIEIWKWKAVECLEI